MSPTAEIFRRNLHRDKELLDTTLRSIGDGVVTTDIEGKITSLNNVAEEIVGWSSSEACGIDFASVFILENEETEQPVEKSDKKSNWKPGELSAWQTIRSL